MDQQLRAELAAWANVVSLKSRRGGPGLSSDATRDQVLRWLQWNDPNGEYTDASRPRNEDPLTFEEAWDALSFVRSQEDD